MTKQPQRESHQPCPKCGNPDVVPIVYGEPGLKLIDEERQGKLFLGGCVVGDHDPQKHCKACGIEFDLPPSRVTRWPRLKK